MRTGRIKRELELLEASHGELECDPDFGWFVIKQWTLPEGWNLKVTPILVLIPPGYPTTPPDNFCTDADLKTAGGQDPGNSGFQDHLGRRWRFFSYHVESGDWQPHEVVEQGHNLLTFLEGVAKRLSEVG